MNFRKSFILALKSLAVSKMRSVLTMLGIIIGVAAVIIIISLGDGLHAMITDEFNSMGSNMVQAQIMGRGSSREAKVEDMYEVVEKSPEVFAGLSPSVSVMGTIKIGTDTYAATVTGVSEDYDQVKSITLGTGRFLQYIDIDRLQKVCVIGAYLEEEGFGTGNALGQSIYLNGTNYTVVGVMEVTDEEGGATAYSDSEVLIPYTNATRINGTSTITSYMFSAQEDKSDQAKALVENKLEAIYGDDDSFVVISMSEMMSIMDTINGTIMSVLIAIAGISLLVGGIGIMNIMLVSVTERTREIGIRKSLGAKGRDIRMQFIIEAATTSALGGLIGIVLGISCANVAGGMLGITAAPSLYAISVAFGVSVGVGILFGYLPANKAAALNPIDALRYD